MTNFQVAATCISLQVRFVTKIRIPMYDVAELLCFTPTVIFLVTMNVLTFIRVFISPVTF